MALGFGLKKRGAIVTVADINGNRAFELAKHLDCDVIDWASRSKLQADVLVNCTPLGMHPNVDTTPYEKSDMRPGMVVFDAVYNPENTLFLKSAREKGCRVVSGIEMFVGQACLQFRLFTGQKASASLMRKLMKDAISNTRDE